MKNIKSILSIFWLFTGFVISANATDFSALFFPGGSKIMGKSVEDIKKILAPVVLSDNEKSTEKKNSQKVTQLHYTAPAAALAKGKNDKADERILTLGKIHMTEATFFFDDRGKLEKIDLILFSEGDNGKISQQDFDALQKKAKNHLTGKMPNITGKRSSVKLAGNTDNSTTTQIRWRTSRFDLALVWPEAVKGKHYLEIKITETGEIGSARKNLETSRSAPTQLRKNIIRKGTQYHLPVPMVNQGNKGYCVSATMARVMQYYGIQAEMNQLAQLFDSDAKTGTSLSALLKVCKKNEAKIHLRVKDEKMIYYDLVEMAKKYNAKAKKEKKPLLPISKISKLASSSKKEKQDELETLMGKMDKDIFVDVFQKKEPGKSVLTRIVKREIDAGRPVIWSTFIVDGKNALGFHLRLINGYDERKRKIVYTDSWGAGKELELMDEDEAWAITIGIFSAKPLE